MPDLTLDDFSDVPDGPTPAQIDLIEQLSEEADIGTRDLLDMCEDIMGAQVENVRALSVEMASALIDLLLERKRQAGRGGRYGR